MQVFTYALLGLGLGAMYSLASQGLVLIYRGSGVLNFAQGAIGMVGAYVEWQIAVQHGLPFGLALVCGVVASALLGAATHLLVMRQLRRASPLARIVATLGVLITLQSAVIVKYGSTVKFVPSALPTHVINLGDGVKVSADRLYLLLIAAALTVVLWAVYKYTRFGLGTTAVAENQRAAATLGWSPDVIATVNWTLGSALAGLAAILISPIVTLQVTVLTNLVLAALAGALIASFRSFPIAFVASVVIGVVETLLTRYATQPGLAQSVPFIVIVVVMVVTGRDLPLRDYFLQRLPAIGSGRVRPLWVIIGTAFGLVLLLVTTTSWIAAITISLAAALILLSIVVITGYAGQLSLAQFAVAGFGAWVAGRLVAGHGWPFLAAAVAGVVATVPLGLVIMLPAARTRGINFAVVTLGLGTTLELMLFDNQNYTGGIAGTQVGNASLFGWNISAIEHPARYGVFALIVFVGCCLIVANVRRGRSGRRMLAVRTNERAAAALGINVRSTKLYAFGFAAALAAAGGIVLAWTNSTITYTTFSNFTSVTYVGWAMIGGIGFVVGPVFGSTLVDGGVGTQLTNDILSGLEKYLTLIGGIILILLIIQNQDGIVKTQATQLRWVMDRVGRRVKWVALRPPRAVTLPAGRRSQVAPRTLEIRDLSVRYGTTVAVDNASVTVQPGRITGLIGPNGAGKTTLVDAVTGFTRPFKGTMLLDGQPIDDWSPARRARRGLSRSFQSLELFEDATVLDNLRVASDPRDLLSFFRDLIYPVQPEFPSEVVAAIHEFDLEQDLYKEVQDLPYGKRRLLAIARAVAGRPSVLLLDEPAAGLSDAETSELATLVKGLAQDWGMAVLLIEHDIDFVMAVCDEIVVLDFGQQIAQGTPDVVRRDPLVIAAYLGQEHEQATAGAPSGAGVEEA